MFCGECGNKNEDDTKFCVECGAPMGQHDPAPVKSIISGGGKVEIGSVKLSVPDENSAVISVLNKDIKANLIFKIVSILLAIAFFMPFFSIQIRIFGMRAGTSMNGWATIFGYGDASGSFSAVFLLLIPIALFVLFQFKGNLEAKMAFIKGRLFTLSMVGFSSGFIFLFIVRSSVSSTFRGNIGASVGFWLSLLCYLIAIAVSVGCLLSVKGKNIKLGGKGKIKSGGGVESESVLDGSVTDSSAENTLTPTREPKAKIAPIVGLPIYMKAVPMGASVLLLVSVFLNWIVIEMGDLFGGLGNIFGNIPGLEMPAMPEIPDITINGWTAIFGHEEFPAIAWAIAFLLIPIIQLALYALQKVIKLDNVKLLLASTALFAVGLILLPVFAFPVNEELYEMGSLGLGFFISVGVYVLAIAASVFFVIKCKKGIAGDN